MNALASPAAPTAADETLPGRSGNIPLGAGSNAAELWLDERGMICDCSGASEALFKYRRSELVWRHVAVLLPQFEALKLIHDGQINPHLRFHCRIGRHYQVVAQDGERFASEIFLNLLDHKGDGRIFLIVRLAMPRNN